MGRMKDFAIEIDENDTDETMAFHLGISIEELKLLTYKAYTVCNGFTRDVIFDLDTHAVEGCEDCKYGVLVS
jgi:hypothetical protein